jgi:DNA-binding winged helix-turn-helix (wHTH) protein
MDSERREFGRYVLDLRRGCLLLDGREVTLRPETFALLTYLAARPGQLVSKEELFAAAWPNLVVTDDTLDQSIGELRRALGENGPRMIATMPKRGYRFDTAAAPTDRRKSGIWHALRWRWRYGILAPLAVMLTFIALWFGMRGCSN